MTEELLAGPSGGGTPIERAGAGRDAGALDAVLIDDRLPGTSLPSGSDPVEVLEAAAELLAVSR